MCCPSPLRRRSYSAAASASTPKRGLMKSVYAPYGPEGARSGQPVTACRPLSAAPWLPNPPYVRSGPVCPRRHVLSMTSSGWSARSVSQASPSRRIVPGVKLSITTSAQPASRLARSRPVSLARSSAMPSLELLKFAKNCDLFASRSPSLKGGAMRSTSMRCADSTRTTVAPWSASPLPTSGPTPTHEKSATLMPVNARARVAPAASRAGGAGSRGSATSAAPSSSAGAGRLAPTGVRLHFANGPGTV